MSDFNHALNLTHDGTLILRIPKGYEVDKVVVEEMGTENRVEYQPTHETLAITLGALDCVERQKAIDAIYAEFEYVYCFNCDHEGNEEWCEDCHRKYMKWSASQNTIERVLNGLPSAQLDRDIPMKPNETTDRAWGIPKKQAVCPKCDYYLGNISFIGDYKGKRITYCETCGQAIDWEGWDSDG